MDKKPNIGARIVNFYIDGFKNMGKTGKQLWLLILIKLFIMFAIWRLVFFPNVLKTDFDSDEERSEHVIEQLTNPE
ncbi:uncharacterized protein DUF4492 [Balneicella halophila]|uniref:Uncharacterized protein DUF4492 n=1 Tax=Balneicella halophila TaxID=1537566 RepID=A0A7L4UR29_BALHA|nr:DUF4492 domain-containing protein [Balneicella halophila]PVX51901.1 uncharacterized protein DUF4492 [Balneicella halophila]